MKELLAVGGGGALGAMARYMTYLLSAQLFGFGFPFGTLIVNVVGSFIMGVLTEGMALAWTVSAELRLFLVVGFLGAFTTFSTFSLDVAVLYERGHLGLTLIYILASFTCSVGALFAGLYVTRQLVEPVL